MPDPTFSVQVLAAARGVARIEVKLRQARHRLAELEEQLRAMKRQLRMLIDTTEPYIPPTADEVHAALRRAEELER